MPFTIGCKFRTFSVTHSLAYKIENMLSVQKPVSRKNPHYLISNLFLIVLLYIVEAKKGCKKKSLNILSLAADLLKHN